MRKVYQNEKNSLALPMALAASLIATAAVFLIIPFSHLVNNPQRTLELRKTSVADLPPPVDESLIPPPIEADKPPEAPPEPQLAETPNQIPLTADLDIVVGAGGTLAGFGDERLAAVTEVLPQEAFDVSDLEKRPEAVSQTPPAYPAELRKAKIEGVVTLVFVLTEQGQVEAPRVETSTRAEFEKPALDAVRKWRFRPGMKDGQAVRTYVRIPIRFRVTSG